MFYTSKYIATQKNHLNSKNCYTNLKTLKIPFYIIIES